MLRNIWSCSSNVVLGKIWDWVQSYLKEAIFRANEYRYVNQVQCEFQTISIQILLSSDYTNFQISLCDSLLDVYTHCVEGVCMFKSPYIGTVCLSVECVILLTISPGNKLCRFWVVMALIKIEKLPCLFQIYAVCFLGQSCIWSLI